MIIPIGHDRGEVWRWPLITPVLIFVCFAVFWLQSDTIRRDREEGIRTFQEVLDYLFEHPWVEPDPRLHLPDWLLTELETVRERADELGLTRGWEYDSQSTRLAQLTESWIEVRDRSLAQRFGYRVNSPLWWSTLSYQFMHAGWMHLIGNLLILYLVGAPIEDVWGRPVFLLFYLTGGVVAALVDGAMGTTPHLPLIGASGAVAAAMGAFLIRFARARLHFAYWFFVIGGTFTAPAWIMLLLWVGREGSYAWFFSKVLGVSSGVAHWAHVGGFVFGAGFAAFIHVFEIENKILRKRIGAKVGLTEHAALQKAHDLVDRGAHGEAWALLESEQAKHPEDYDLGLALWYLAVEMQRTRQAAPSLVPLLIKELASGDPVAGAELATEVLDREPSPTSDRRALVQLAEGMYRGGAGAAAAPLIRAAMESPEPLGPPDLLRLARLAERLDPIRASKFAAEALATHEELAPYVRDELNRLERFGRGPATEPSDAESLTQTGSVATETEAPPQPQTPASDLEVLAARLIELRGSRMVLELAGRRLQLKMETVAAVSAARIRQQGVLPWLVLDLVLPESPEQGRSRLVRLLSTELDVDRVESMGGTFDRRTGQQIEQAFERLVAWAARASSAPGLLIDLEQTPPWLPTFASSDAYERTLSSALARAS